MSQLLPERFNAFRIHSDLKGYRSGVEELGFDDLNAGEVLIRAHYSAMNYKDALAATGKGKILRRFPLIGGIDVAGEVVESDSGDFEPGDRVLVTGSGLSEHRDGGFSEYQRLDAQWVIPLPDGLTLKQAMILGTAGFTAALSLYRMEALGQCPDDGPIVVTGASGGVGSMAISLLASAGYEVHAITGKLDAFPYLESLGASQCISRHDLYWGENALESAHWAGAIDTVGGAMLDGLTRVIKPWGNIACCGLAGGAGLNTTVMPFIIRGISLIGINSSGCPRVIREAVWQRLAGSWKPAALDKILTGIIELSDIAAFSADMLAGKTSGRTLVRLDNTDEEE